MDHVEFMTMCHDVFQRIGLDKLKWVALLGRNIDAYHVEPGAVIAHCRTTGSTEQIEQSRF